MEKEMTKVAIIESKMSRTDWADRFDGAFDFDRYALCSDARKKKILKADVDIEINLDDYTWVVLVGSEALKYYTSVNSITEYSGRCVDDKFLPVINPAKAGRAVANNPIAPVTNPPKGVKNAR